MSGSLRALRAPALVLLGVLAFGVVATCIRALLPWPETYGLRAKFEHFARHKDRYDTVFFGSSYTQRAVLPAVYDATLAEAGIEQTSYNFGVNGMQFYEMDHLIEAVLALQPARLRTVFLESMTWNPIVSFVEGRFEARAVAWHTPRLTLDVLDALGYVDQPLGQRISAGWMHVKMMVRNVCNYAQGGRLLAELRGTDGTFDYLLPSDVDAAAGYQDPDTTRDEEEHKARRRLLDVLEIYHERIARIDAANAAPLDPAEQPLYLVRALFERMEAHGMRAICLMPPGMQPVSESLALQAEGAIRTLLAFNSPERYPRLYAVESRFDRGHLNRDGATLFSRMLAERVAGLTPPDRR